MTVETLLTIMTVLVAVAVGVLVVVLLEVRRAVMRLSDFIRRTEGPLHGTLGELNETLVSIRSASQTIGAVAEDSRRVSGSLAMMSEGLMSTVHAVEGLAAGPGHYVSALKAGIRAAVWAAIMNLFKR